MGNGPLRIEHQDPECRENLCLQEYETVFQEHQDRLYRRVQAQGARLTPDEAALAQSFERFRQVVWGEGSYADRIRVRVTPAAGQGPAQDLRLSDIAVQGLVTFADVKTLMEMGRVQFLIPNYFCSPGNVSRGYLEWPVQSRRDFESLLRELEEVRPLHGEGMGNVFWLRCMPDSGNSGSAGFAAELQNNSAFRGLTENAQSLVSEADENPCGEQDIAFFDENTGRAVCEEDEDTGEELAPGIKGKLSSLAEGIMVALGDQAVQSASLGLPASFESIGSALTQASLKIGMSLGQTDLTENPEDQPR